MNHGHEDFQSSALPTELTALKESITNADRNHNLYIFSKSSNSVKVSLFYSKINILRTLALWLYGTINTVNMRSDITLAIVSGVLLMLGFQPFDLYMLPWVGIVPLLIALRGKSPLHSFLLGLLTGFTWFTGTVYWVFHSVYFYGNVPMAISILMVALLCLYLGSYVGIFSLLFNAVLKNSRLPALLIVPLLWVPLEFLRTYLLTGYPWALLAYSQYTSLNLIQIADITGVYGISFLVAALSGLIFDISVNRETKLRTASGIVYAVIVALSLFYGSAKLAEGEEGREVNVSVVQGNIPQDRKWDDRFQKDVIDTYQKLTIEALAEGPDLIVWPETAVPFIFGYHEALTEETVNFQKGLDTYLLFGSIVLNRKEPGRSSFTNSAILLSPEGDVASVYDKMHLVPYGEYIPFRELMPFARRLTAGIGDFTPGEDHLVMKTPFAKIGNLICYEIIFPDQVRRFVEGGADMLVTITNDAWFGRTSAPYQHFAIAVFRAIENRVPVIRSANTGISGFIDSRGRIGKTSDIFVGAVLNEKVIAGSRRSFYTEYGDLIAYFCIGGAIPLIVGSITRGRKR